MIAEQNGFWHESWGESLNSCMQKKLHFIIFIDANELFKKPNSGELAGG